MSNIVPIAYRCRWIKGRVPGCKGASVPGTATVSATAAAHSTKRIDHAWICREVHRVFGEDRRGLKRAAEVRAPELLAGVHLERLRAAVKALNAQDRIAGDRRRGQRPHRPRLPDLLAVRERKRVNEAVLAPGQRLP